MSDDTVKAELHAVTTLRRAITRYSSEMRDALHAVRRDVAAAETRIEETVRRQESHLRRSQAELAAALRAFDPAAPNASQLKHAVAAGQRRVEDAHQELARAKRAATIVATSRSDLVKSLQTVDGAVSETASVAGAALATLDGKLAQYKGGSNQSAKSWAVAALVLASEAASAAPPLAQLGADALGAFGVQSAVAHTSVQEYREDLDEAGKEHVAQADLESRRQEYSGPGWVSKP